MPGRRGAGRPTREEAATIEIQVLDAARKTFCEDGFTEASMDRIAQCIGASKLTIYRRYPSKEALLVAMVDRDIARMRTIMREELGTDPEPVKQLYDAARRLFDFITRPENLAFSLFIRGEGARRESIRDRFGAWYAAIQEPLVDLIRDAQHAGQIREDSDPVVLADILIDLVDGVAEPLRHGKPLPGRAGLDQMFATRWSVFGAYALVSDSLH